MSLIEGLSDGYSKVVQFFSDFVDMIYLAIEALQTFYNMLVDFDDRIVNMVDNCGTNEFSGLPVIKAIATYHYVVGDVVFYLMYMIILLGCLFTIFRIITLMFEAVLNLFSSFKSIINGSSITSFGSFFQ